MNIKIKAPLILGTHNAGKILEIRDILEPFAIDCKDASSLNVPEPEETEDTLEGNAILKAKAVFEFTEQNSLSDDTGLEIDALDGAPGVYSARWAGENKDFKMARTKILNLMQYSNVRTARFVTVLAICYGNNEIKTFRGVLNGKIAEEESGTHGFGYDQIFIPDGYNVTLADIGSVIKNQISHRKKALDLFVNWLNS